jgi:hypothetical protein
MYLSKYPGHFKQSLFSFNELFLPLFLNPGNVNGARCTVGGSILGSYLRICNKNILQRYVAIDVGPENVCSKLSNWHTPRQNWTVFCHEKTYFKDRENSFSKF